MNIPIFIPSFTLSPIILYAVAALIGLALVYIIVSVLVSSSRGSYVYIFDPSTNKIVKKRVEHIDGALYKAGNNIVIIPSSVKPFYDRGRMVWPAITVAKRNVVIDPVESLSLVMMNETKTIRSIDDLILELYNAGILRREFRIVPNIALSISINADEVAKRLITSVMRASEDAIYTISSLTVSFKEYEKLIEKYVKLTETRAQLLDKLLLIGVVMIMAVAIAYVVITSVK